MAIRGPKHGVPTHRGWVHEKTGELLKVQKISSTQIAEWHGTTAQPEPVVAVQTLHEAPVVESFLSVETKHFYYGDEDVDTEEE